MLVGRLTDAKLLQPAKVLALISVTPLGIVIEDKPAQPENASLPIEVIVLGMLTAVRLVQFAKASSAMAVTS